MGELMYATLNLPVDLEGVTHPHSSPNQRFRHLGSCPLAPSPGNEAHYLHFIIYLLT